MLQAHKDHREEMTLGNHTYQEYRAEMLRLYGKVSAFSDEIYGLTEAQWELARSVEVGKTTTDGWNESMLTAAQNAELFPPLVVTATTEPAKHELETFSEWLTRWSRENARKVQLQASLRVSEERKVQLQASLRVSEELATATTEEGQRGGEFKAGGGPVQAGKSYIVGEREAELFVPRQDGDIYNQQQLAGGDININTGVSQRAFNNMAEDWMRGLGG